MRHILMSVEFGKHTFVRTTILFTALDYTLILYNELFLPFLREMNGRSGDHWFWSQKNSFSSI